MAWQEVQTDVGAKVGRVKYSVALKHGGARISVPKPVIDQLGWTKKTCFRLLVGGGDTEGKLRLEPSDKGQITSKAPPSGEGMIVRLGRWAGLAPRDVDAIAVEHEAVGNALIISLPSHAQNAAPPPKPQPMTPSAPRAPLASSPTANGKISVNNRFFDDPPKTKALPVSGIRNQR
jgi:hypothetical protein